MVYQSPAPVNRPQSAMLSSPWHPCTFSDGSTTAAQRLQLPTAQAEAGTCCCVSHDADSCSSQTAPPVDGEPEEHGLPPRLLFLVRQPQSTLRENGHGKLTKERDLRVVNRSGRYVRMRRPLCPLGLSTVPAGTSQILHVVVSANQPRLSSLCCFLTPSTGQKDF